MAEPDQVLGHFMRRALVVHADMARLPVPFGRGEPDERNACIRKPADEGCVFCQRRHENDPGKIRLAAQQYEGLRAPGRFLEDGVETLGIAALQHADLDLARIVAGRVGKEDSD